MQAPSLKPDPGSATLPIAGTARKRVLFVDDEMPILEGLRAVLRPQRHEWDMVFALGGPAGLHEVQNSRFDVVVADMRMPVLDGAALLTRVKELQPHAVRLVLSGQTDAQTALKSVFTAHQFLAKPCDAEKLRSVVKRCCELNALLAGSELRALAGDVSVLPAAPTTYLAISRALANPSSGIQDVSRIVECEPSLCAKVLQVVNSAFFGLPRAVSSVSQAATYLGTLALRDLALAMETVAGQRPKQAALSIASYHAFRTNSLAVGLLARRWLGHERRRADEAFVAGMLRDMGHLVLVGRGIADSSEGQQHAAISAYLLGLWGLPHPILEAVAFHEHPERVEHSSLEVVDVVHACDAFVSRVAPSPFQEPPAVDLSRLEAMGVSRAQLTELQGQADAVVREAKEMLSP